MDRCVEGIKEAQLGSLVMMFLLSLCEMFLNEMEEREETRKGKTISFTKLVCRVIINI